MTVDQPTTELLDSASDSAAIIEAADRYAAREPQSITTGRGYNLEAFVLAGGQRLQLIDLADYAPLPLRKEGAVTLIDWPSFAGYVNNHAHPELTSLWADIDKDRVVAVLDDHQRSTGAQDPRETDAGWGKHRAGLDLRTTEEWRAWTAVDGKLLTQSQFLDFLEERAQDIADPDPATFYEIARSFQAATKANFTSAIREQSGAVTLKYEQTIAAKAGQKGDLEIPESVVVRLAVYEQGALHDVIAKFRYRLDDGQLALGLKLIRAAEVKRHAFGEVIAEIAKATDLPVLAGTPRA